MSITPAVLPPTDECGDVIHIMVPGERTCLCGAHVYDEPPFPVDFWELLDNATHTGQWGPKEVAEWEKLKQHAENYGADLSDL
jgi:hypothetical protein